MTGNPGGWKCDDCRKNRLELRRACNFRKVEARCELRVVWAKNGVTTARCPRSLISGASLRWLEIFAAWQLAPRTEMNDWPAKDVEALHCLAEVWKEGLADEQRRQANH
jgi:hypothetical protein